MGFGVIALFGHDFMIWQQLSTLWSTPLGTVLGYLVAAAEILGGAAIQFRRSAGYAALLLALVYLFFACRWIPQIVAAPGVYDHWGNFFEQFSLVVGGLLVYACTAPAAPLAAGIRNNGRLLYGLCVVSFTLEQLIYLSGTASLVPKWLPPGPMLWAVLTTIAMALAAVALLTGRRALLAARLLTVMFLVFGVLIWLPRLILHPGNHVDWGANAQNLLLTGAAWIVADWLGGTSTPETTDAATH